MKFTTYDSDAFAKYIRSIHTLQRDGVKIYYVPSTKQDNKFFIRPTSSDRITSEWEIVIDTDWLVEHSQDSDLSSKILDILGTWKPK